MKTLNKCRINVMISNMDEAIHFYCKTLGMELANRYGDHYAEIQAPGLLIGLHPTSDKVVRGNNISIGLGVTDFDMTIKELRSKGVNCRPEEDGYIRLAYFTDPDENQLFLAENES